MPYVLPAPKPKPTFWDWAGEAYGISAGKAADALLQALLGGQIGSVPTGSGKLNLPGGGQATPGPGLQAQINQGQLPQLIAQKQFQPWTTYQPSTRKGFTSNQTTLLDQQLKQAQIGQVNAYTDYLRTQGLIPGGSTPSTSPTSPSQSGLTAEEENRLLKSALDGDEADEQLARQLGLI